MTPSQRAVEAALNAADYIPNPDNRKWMRAAIEAALAMDGVALVPKEPTEDMLDFGACYEDPDGLHKGHPIFGEGDISRDIYRAMLSAASAEPDPALQGWQPIESAPKDGTRVNLCWRPTGGLSEHVELGKWGAAHEWCNTYGRPFHGTPDYWMPLPPPPAASEGEERK